MEEKEKWDVYIEPNAKWFDLNFSEVWKYRDLIVMFVKRDFIAQYKQTILGPLWFLIQPIITTLTYIVVFAGIADLSTAGQPASLFYLSGILFWNYFSSTFLKISETFLSNTNIFGKIYFPRLVVPISVVISSMISFMIQLMLFIGVFLFQLFVNDYESNIQPALCLFPFLVILMAILSVGIGIIISSLTIKYRDLRYLVTFGVPLLMYTTPVVYPLSSVKNDVLATLLKLNPMTGIIETFRYSVLGTGVFSWEMLLYTFTVTIVLFFAGITLFNKVEKNFMDSI
jgi:lipopolysaccharide transport system permease protein